jgi:hypothetical protein
MKVAINRCFGGFGLSNEAFELLLQKKGIEFQKVPAKDSFRERDSDYYFKGHVGEEEHFLWDYQFIGDRSDPDLISVLEEMGDKANGWAAEIAIIDIPDDVKWHIHEYDGMEHVAEDHRTWS